MNNQVFISYNTALENIQRSREVGDYDKAIDYCRMALPYMQIFHHEMVAVCYYAMAVCYTEMGKNEQSIAYFHKVLHSISCSHPDKQEEHIAYKRNLTFLSMSNVYNNIKDYEKAIYYCNKAIIYYTQRKDYKWLAMAQAIKANSYKESGNIDSLIKLTQEAYGHILKVSPKEISGFNGNDGGSIELTCQIGAHLGELFLDKKMPDSAAVYLEAVQHLIPLSPEFTQIWYGMARGRLYSQQRKWALAEKYLLYNTQKAKRLKFNDMETGGYNDLSTHYSEQGNKDKALLFFQKYHKARERTYGQAEIHKINQLELKHQAEIKDREITEKKLLIKSNQSQLREKNILLSAISVGCLLLAIMALLIYKSYRNKKLVHETSLLNQEQQQKISNLQSRVSGEEQERNRIAKELHDGTVGQLVSIKLHLQSIIARNHIVPTTALHGVTQQVTVAAQELRRTTHNLMPALLLKHGLEHAVDCFCDKTQDNSGIEIHFQAIGPIDKHSQDVELSLFRIVQELVQNVLKHAQASTITVQLSQREDALSLTVEDNGIGLSPTGRPVSTGFGLRNIAERVQLLGGFFDIKGLSGQGTTAFVEIRG